MIVVLFVFMSSAVTAASPKGKTIDVELSGTTDFVNVGDSIVLTAETGRHGSSYVDQWEGAQKENSFFNKGKYLSTATFYAETPGTFEVTYTITMSAGNSKIMFTGEETKLIEVIHPVIGADIRDLVFTPVTDSDGTLVGYSVRGSTFKIWSNGDETRYGSIILFFEPDEISRSVNVTFRIDGQTISYEVLITRPVE